MGPERDRVNPPDPVSLSLWMPEQRNPMQAQNGRRGDAEAAILTIARAGSSRYGRRMSMQNVNVGWWLSP